MTVSVALATYNGERFLREQLESLARQTKLPDELVVCDDGSKDHTLEIVAEFAKDSPFPVNIHRNERNLGHADNFLQTASLCKGELIAFCDQDDVWQESKLERCCASFDDPDVQMVVHAAQVVQENLEATGKFYPQISEYRSIDPLRFDPWHVYPGFAMVFRSHLMALADYKLRPQPVIPGEPGFMPHDRWVYLLAGVSGKIVLLPETLAIYRRHESNATLMPRQGLAKLAGAVSYSEAKLELFYQIANQFSHLLEQALPRLDGVVKPRIERGARFYRAMADHLAQRIAFYRAGSRLQKAAKLTRLIKQGAYRNRQRGGFGARSLVKDCVVLITGNRSV